LFATKGSTPGWVKLKITKWLTKQLYFFHDAKEALIRQKIRHAPQLVLMISQP